ncbi:MAG: sensor domain-containing diguanylate cyclase [Myxococcota bacterium]|nr:sensor domain-containing diguanylate cyclase [Myxococcota bacterium]
MSADGDQPSGRGYDALEHLVDEVVFIHSEDRRIVFVSPSVRNVLGYTQEAFRALRTVDLIHPDDLPEAVRTAVELRETEGASYRSMLRIRSAEGSYRWCEIVGRNLLHTDVAGVVNTLRDVSDRRAHEDRLRHQALHDELTGLSNRRGFTERLEAELARSRGRHLGLLILDLDGFKAVNDELGHLAGDELLARCARRIDEALRVGDSAARLGGDEFAVLCHRVTSEEALLRAAERVRAAVSGCHALADGSGVIGASIGAALHRPGDPPEALLRRADDALYVAKRAGGEQTVSAEGSAGSSR